MSRLVQGWRPGGFSFMPRVKPALVEMPDRPELQEPLPGVSLQWRYREAIREVARECVGVRELPGNRGPFVERVLRHVGILEPSPWCTAVACWILQEAALRIGCDDTCPDLASGAKLWRWALEHPDLCTLVLDARELMPGDVVVMGSTEAKAARIRRGSLASGHTWIADSVEAHGVHASAEGNTSPEGVREGQGFYRRQRAFTAPLVVGGIRFLAIPLGD